MQINVKLNYGILLHQQLLCHFMTVINYGLPSLLYCRLCRRRQQAPVAHSKPVIGQGIYNWVFHIGFNSNLKQDFQTHSILAERMPHLYLWSSSDYAQ